MNTKESDPKKIIGAVAALHETLEPFTMEERKKVITMAMVLFGESAPHASAPGQRLSPELPSEPSDGISSKALAWMKKYAVQREQLEHVFAIEDDSVEVSAARLPGGSKRKQTVEAYVICGLAGLLKTGEPAFTDADARAVCQKVGCYDSPNHSNAMKAFGNLIVGSKDSGWRLTNPGLTEAANIVKKLVPAANA